jgi:hypothetical protein
VRLFPPRTLPAAEVPARLAIGTSAFEAVSPGTLLFLTEVPAGSYRVRLVRKSSARGELRRIDQAVDAGQLGELRLAIGRESFPVARWPLPAGARDSYDGYRFDLPVVASSLAVTADARALRSIERAALVPALRGNPPLSIAGRARDAARYGSSIVYALDDRIWLEPHGFWVMGERQPDVLFATDAGVGSLELEALNGPLPNRLRIRAGDWTTLRTLAPDERWAVRVPLVDRGQATIVNFDVEKSFRPADVDPASKDRRRLGCWIEVR